MKYKTPTCIDKIGEGVFLKVPLYKRKNKLKLLYVNPKLFEEYFKTSYTFEKACEYIEEYFSVTINDKYRLDDNQIGEAYVDYQADPTNIALDGNSGSGRAYYIGEDFNVKGELTPLATSPYPVYSNGKLSLESAIHETLISNVLGAEFKTTTYQTLAVLDPEETYLFPGSDNPMKCGVMVRVNKDNQLYRFSHRFVNKKPFTGEELYHIATNMGVIEGQKIIHRLIHGAWSLGNMSIDTNMIDFDTTYFVQNRNPSFSFTPKYKTNYFGFEDLGQLKMLEILINSELNIDNVTLEELEKILCREKDEEILRAFPMLMGIEIEPSEELRNLTNEFIRLSKFMFKSYDELNTMNKNNNEVALFNFSNFFRHYPLLVKDNIYSVNRCLRLILNGDGEIFDKENNDLKNIIDGYFKKYKIDTDSEFLKLIEDVIRFIIAYDKIFKSNVKDIGEAVKRAYIINEDRKHLFNNEYTKYRLASSYDGTNNDFINNIMNIIIDGSIRNNGGKVCDLDIENNIATFNTFVGTDMKEKRIDLNKQKKLKR
jgi:Uncharacterized conserved protein